MRITFTLPGFVFGENYLIVFLDQNHVFGVGQRSLTPGLLFDELLRDADRFARENIPDDFLGLGILNDLDLVDGVFHNVNDIE